jgi:VCBS repeat-containing protein
MSISNFEDQQYTEQQGPIQLSTQGAFANGVNYGSGFVEFAVSQNGDNGDHLFLTSAGDPNANGAISITGNLVYLGTGTAKIQIGSVDSNNNGLAGHALRINFDNVTVPGTSPVTNGDFSQGLTGWTSVLDTIDLGVTKIAGWATPESPLIKYPSQTPGGDDNDMQANFSGPRVAITGDGRLVLEDTSMQSSSFGVVHGPAAYSDAFHAAGGMVLKFDWAANLVNDDYHVVGYLLNSDTGAITIALQGWGATGSGVATVAVPTDGNYRFVFVSGTFDATGGQALGASMFIDNIRVEAGAITDAVVQTLAHQVIYENTSDHPDAVKTVTVSAKNATGVVSTDDLVINVTGVNDAPIQTGPGNLPNGTEDVAYTVSAASLLAGISDPDLDTLSIIGLTPSQGFVTNSSNGLYTIVQPPNFNGTVVLRYTVSDGHGGSIAVAKPYFIAAVNDAPTAFADSGNATEDGPAVLVNVLANDADVDVGDGRTLVSVNTAGTVGSVTISNGQVSYAPGANFQSLGAGATGNDSFTYTMRDNGGLQSTATVNMTITGVNDAPVAVADFALAPQNTPVVIDVLGNDTDVDAGDTKTLVSVNSTGTVGTVSIVNGKAVYDPGTHFQSLPSGGAFGHDSFTYTMKDSAGALSTASATVTIIGANDAPVALADSGTATEDGGAVIVDVLANDTDVDAGDFPTLLSVNGTGTVGSVSIVSGKVSYDPGAHFQSLGAGATALDTFTYTMRDNGGARSTATVTMTITGTNDGPVAVADAGNAVEDGGAVTLNVLANDTDVDAGDTRTLVSVNATGTVGAASIVDGKVSYDPGAQFQSLGAGATVTDTFSYTMKDSAGALSTASATLTITGVNDAPVALADTGTATEDGAAVIINVLANDTDVDAGDTQTLVSVNTVGTVGSASIVDGKVSYDPGAHFQSLGAGATAIDTFTYTMKDSGGVERTATVTMTITGVNDGPVAVADTGNAVEDGGAVIINVLANDTDVDAGDTKTLVSVNAAGTVGAVSIVDGKVSYDPGTHFQTLGVGATATDTFSYTMKDSAGVEQTATVTMTIAGTNDGPVAHADTASVLEKASVTINVLANDTDIDAGDVKTIASVEHTSALGGTASIVNGALQYTANADTFDLLGNGQSVTDTLTYTMKDASGAVSSATVTVTVTGVADGANIMGTIKSDTGSTALVGTALDEAIYGNNGDDQMFGNGGSDHLFGENGEDTLNGGIGIDFLDGGNGKDVLIGGKGSDFLTGGLGNDVFVFNADSASTDVDVITDFNVGNDSLQLLNGLSITALNKVDFNHDGVFDTELVLSNGSHVELLGVSGITSPGTLL